RFVDELVGRRAWRVTGRAESLIVLQRRPAEEHGAVRSSPLVTCIMPTADRRQFVPLAIQSFLAQDYAERELVIVDDGREAVDDLVPQDARVRYLRLEGRKSIGEKRNLACAAARGHYVAHFDDDDWSSPSRLRYQLEELERSRASIGGLTQVNYYDPALERAFQYRYPPGRRPWVAGNTLFYTKAQWSKQPFEHVDVGEDARFIWADRTASVRVHERCDFFVALLHGSNVAKKQTHQRFWHPMPCSTIRALMGSNFERYREAAEARRSGVRERAG
ncbi:MAG TPA: glycosyltransferase family 2 protein, partial [Polyangiaceae bacterium]